MAKISTLDKPVKAEDRPSLHMRIIFNPHQIDVDLWPSTLVGDVDDETGTPEQVLASLNEEFGLDHPYGVISWLQDQQWLVDEGRKWNIEVEITKNGANE